MCVFSRHGSLLKVLLPAFLGLFGLVPSVPAQSGVTTGIVEVGIDAAYLGVEMEDVTAANMASYKLGAERGVIVRSVEKGSPAQTAGLQEKDVILEYAGIQVLSATQFARLVRETPVGRKVDMLISRDGKRVNLSASIGEREGRHSTTGRRLKIVPRSEQGDFDLRVPGPRQFEFRMPGGDWQQFSMPPGRVLRYSTEKPRLGITLQPLTDQMAVFLGVAGKKGALVTSIIEGSPAAGKLKAGDVIIKADDKSISEPDDLIRIVGEKGKDSKLTLTIVRDKKEMSVTVEVATEDSRGNKGGFRL